ncbi:hypothetical protein, partial [Phormidium sp. CCY1219]|uniref:hypothetical protein n=1 Tax=Phormidium sp. CCY1219 TaxID=2886104 RepID=UPI002D1F42F6
DRKLTCRRSLVFLPGLNDFEAPLEQLGHPPRSPSSAGSRGPVVKTIRESTPAKYTTDARFPNRL